MTDTASVTVELVQVDRTPGRGALVALAVCEIDVAGIVFRLQGVQARRAPGGGLAVVEPHCRGPDGGWYPGVLLPAEVHRALASLIRAELTEAA